VNYKCIACGKNNLEKNTIGLNKKILGRSVNKIYCIECLAEYLGVSVEELFNKIEEFKYQGCKLFA
jgi:uncharacterized protein (DUF1810 family)